MWPLMTGRQAVWRCHHSGRDWTSVLSGVRLMSVVSCHYMSHSISQYYGPHRETNLNIITGRGRHSADSASAPYFLIIPPGLQAAVYSSATTGQALSTSHLLVQICTCNYHLFAPLNSPPPSTGFTGENPQDCKLKVKQRR